VGERSEVARADAGSRKVGWFLGVVCPDSEVIMERRFITQKEIENKRTKNGGFTKKVLASWGVPWIRGKGPPRGWKEWILKYGIPYEA